MKLEDMGPSGRISLKVGPDLRPSRIPSYPASGTFVIVSSLTSYVAEYASPLSTPPMSWRDDIIPGQLGDMRFGKVSEALDAPLLPSYGS